MNGKLEKDKGQYIKYFEINQVNLNDLSKLVNIILPAGKQVYDKKLNDELDNNDRQQEEC